MTDFKVGDRVRVKDEELSYHLANMVRWFGQMEEEELRGSYATVQGFDFAGDVELSIDGQTRLWSVDPKHLEPVTENPEKVNHPPHYNTGKIEVIDFIEDQGLDFHLGNVVKYVTRAAHKSSLREDLEKAKWYIERRLELTE